MNRRVILLAWLIVGVLASGYVATQRIRVESQNRAVEIVLDYDEIQQIAAATGKSTVDVMRSFKAVGATSIAITEETVKDAIDNKFILPFGDGQYAIHMEELPRILDQLKIALPKINIESSHGFDAVNGLPTSKYMIVALAGNPPQSYIEQLPLGIQKQALSQVKDAGLEPVARLVNYPGVSPEAINGIIKDVKSKGISKVIFMGDQVLGFKGSVDNTAKALLKNDVYFGRVEFSKQKGELKLAEKAQSNVITVHSIMQDEMPKLDRASIVERFQKAVRERGVRMCYVRMYETASADMLRDNADYVASIYKAIHKAGYEMKPSHPLGNVDTPSVVRGLVGVGVAAGALLLILALVDLSSVSFVVWALSLMAICAGMSGAAEIGRKAVALLSALVFPTLAVLNATKDTPESPIAPAGLLKRTIGRFLLAVMTVSAGGMLIVGLLSERSFMLRIDQFMGVKLAHLLPVLVLALLYAGGVAWKSGKWSDQKVMLCKKAQELASNPILIGQAAAMLVVLIVVGLMVARSGNDSGVGVSDFELRFRSILDKVMYVRPRTKEFLIGYPALILGIAFALRGMRKIAAPLVVIGSIGLISALNTFCHIHTPVELSVLRVINGTIVGGLIGLIALKLFNGSGK